MSLALKDVAGFARASGFLKTNDNDDLRLEWAVYKKLTAK